MSNHFIEEIHHKNRAMMSMEAALNLYYLLKETIDRGIPGDIAEIGCYRGLTALMLKKTLDLFQSDKELHVFDSFEGLPKKDAKDVVSSSLNMKKHVFKDNSRINQGWFSCSLQELKDHFEEFRTKLPAIHQGWFDETLKVHLPKTLAFCHVDGDFYSSTMDALINIYPRLAPGAIAVIDDYCDPVIHKEQNALPGVKRACDEFFSDKKEKIEVLAAGTEYQAFFRRLPYT